MLLGDAIVTSLAQSMKKLADAIHNFKTRPIIKVNVMLNSDKVWKESLLPIVSAC